MQTEAFVYVVLNGESFAWMTCASEVEPVCESDAVKIHENGMKCF